MLEFHMGTLIFQIIVLLVPIAIIGIIIYGILVSSKRSKAIRTLERQNEELLEKLAKIEKE